MSTLTKEMGIPLVLSGGQPYQAAKPGSPAYCTQQIVGYSTLPGGSGNEQEARERAREAYNAMIAAGVPPDEAKHVLAFTVVTPSPKQKPIYKKVCYPAVAGTPEVPAVPPSVVPRFNLGWNSGARSVKYVRGDATASFKATRSVVGAIVGFAGSADNAIGLPVTTHAIEVSRGEAYVVENGRRVHALGSYISSDTLVMERSGWRTQYAIKPSGGAPTASYMSYSAPVGDVWLGASLYAGGDAISAATLDAGITLLRYGSGSVAIGPIAAIGAVGSYCFGAAEMHPLTVTGVAANVGMGAAQLKPMTAIGAAHRYAFGTAEMHPMSAYGAAGMASPGYGLGVGYLHPVMTQGLGLTGGIGHGQVTLRKIAALGADRPYGAGHVEFAPMYVYGDSGDGPDRARIMNWSISADAARTGMVVFAVLRQDASVSSAFSVELLTVAAISESAHVDPSFDISQELYTAISEYVRQRGTSSVVLYRVTDGRFVDASETWSVNEETAASTAYSGFGFTAFARVGDTVFGVREDGLFRLGGDTDDGANIDSVVALGKLKFGVGQFKYVPNLYVGVSSRNQLFVKVVTPQGAWVYRARSDGAQLQQQRFDLGRGLRANYYEFELYNSCGADFELDTVEFLAVAADRRI